MESALLNAGLWSYGLAAAGFTLFAVRLLLGWRSSLRAWFLLAATLTTALWAASAAHFAYLPGPAAWLISSIFDTLRYGAWFLFIGSLLVGEGADSGGSNAVSVLPRWMLALVVTSLVCSLVFVLPDPLPRSLEATPGNEAFGARLSLAILGLMLVEQLIRRASPVARWGIKPLCVGLAGTFALDLYFFADAMLFGRIDTDIWVARGIANLLIIPFMAVATARNTGWTIEMHVSRGAVFHSTAILLSGGFLLIIAGAGYFVRYFGGEWGRALQIEFLFGALLVGILVVSSGSFRSKLRVFVSKHFFSYRYDYREEWLRFTRSLSAESSLRGVQEQCIGALADLVESPAGTLWLKQDDGAFRPAARWNLPATEAAVSPPASLQQFLESTGWLIEVREYASHRERYTGLDISEWLASLTQAWLIVPLVARVDLVGFVVLASPRAAVEVNWEVRDLLKAASRQAASYLEQIRATEALLEARKFDAFNRMSAFVVHDLKNLVAQLSLMLKNAERHRANPEFQRDMLTTVEHVVGRMNQLMLQLRTGTTPIEKQRVTDLEAVVRRICAAKSGRKTPIDVNIASGIAALGHEDRLEHVIGHLIQNALDATADRGKVAVRAFTEDGQVVLEVADTGVGMTPEFIRDRLFKPFETSKAAGMGIGVYESAQYVGALGGQILYDSTPNQGTRVQVRLPAADSAIAPDLKPKALV